MIENLSQLLQEKSRNNPDTPAQYAKDDKGIFRTTSFSMLYSEVCACAAALSEMGVQRGDRVGLISDNRKEWLISDLGIISLGAADVPRGRDATAQELSFILSYSECSVVMAENQGIIDTILSVRSELPHLEKIIILDKRCSLKACQEAAPDLHFTAFSDLLSRGKKLHREHPEKVEKEISQGGLDDTVSIIFTSGTTGDPKGVMLSNRVFLHQVQGVPELVDINPGEIWLSVLPVWHSFERVIQYIAIGSGSALAYSKPIGKIMLQDFQAIRPHWMGSVPRIWESLQNGILKAVSAKPLPARLLFRFFLAVGSAHASLSERMGGRKPRFRPRSRLLDRIYAIIPFLILTPLKLLGDTLIFSSIRQKLGGRFRAGVSGGGSLPHSIERFFQSAGICLLNGYGLTESGPVIAVRSYFRPIPGTLRPFPGTELRIVDESGNDLGPNQRGEILARGPQIMKGYFKRDDLSQKMIDPKGWLHTGDLGVMTIDGDIDIRGRAKDTIVLFGGENIEPVPIEAKLRESPYIEQAMVLGQDRKFLGALIVPDAKQIERYIKSSSVPYISREDMLELPDVWELINSEVQDLISPKNGFKHFERIYRFSIVPRSFEIGRELSAKQEIKRFWIREMYAKEIDALFEK